MGNFKNGKNNECLKLSEKESDPSDFGLIDNYEDAFLWDTDLNWIYY